MGLMMLIAMPYMGGITDAQLKSVSRRLAGRATYLYDEASARKLVIQLVFDMDHNAYFVMTADPYSTQPAFFPDHSTSGAPVILPDAVRIRDVTVEGVGTLSRGTIATAVLSGRLRRCDDSPSDRFERPRHDARNRSAHRRGNDRERRFAAGASGNE